MRGGYKLGTHLKRYLMTEKISRRALAKTFSTSKGTVDVWARGARLPEIKTLITLSQMLGVKIDDMVYREEDTPVTELPETTP